MQTVLVCVCVCVFVSKTERCSPSFSYNTVNGCTSSCLAHSTTPNRALLSSSNALNKQRKKVTTPTTWARSNASIYAENTHRRVTLWYNNYHLKLNQQKLYGMEQRVHKGNTSRNITFAQRVIHHCPHKNDKGEFK